MPEKGTQYSTSRAVLAKKVWTMRRKGEMTAKQVADRIGKSERYVQELTAQYEKSLEGSGDLPEHRPEMYAEWVEARLGRAVGRSVDEQLEEFEAFFNDFANRKTGLQPIHREWVRQALSHDRVIINCPPRHAKSTVFSVFLPLWLVCRDRNIQIIIISATQGGANKFCREIAAHMSESEKLIQTFGVFKPDTDGVPWRPGSGELMVQGRIRVAHSGDFTIQSRGVGQQVLGLEADWIIGDDVVAGKQFRSEPERVKLSEYWHGEVMSRLDTEDEDIEAFGNAVVVGQRLHAMDLYGELTQEKDEETGQPSWYHVNYPAIAVWPHEDPDGIGEVLWPARWSMAKLLRKKRDMGSSIFESMYQQNPLPEGSRLVRRNWIYGSEEDPGCLDHDRGAGRPHEYPLEAGPQDQRRETVRVMSLDPPSTKNAGLVVADVYKDVDYFEVDILEVLAEPMQVRDMIAQIERIWELYRPEFLIVEQNAAQRWLLQPGTSKTIDRLKRSGLRIIGHNTGRNKADPRLGVETLAVDFEFGRVRLPYGDADGRSMSALLIQEAMNYGQALTDDVIMALWFIKYNAMRLIPSSRLANSSFGGRADIPARLANGWDWWVKAKNGRR